MAGIPVLGFLWLGFLWLGFRERFPVRNAWSDLLGDLNSIRFVGGLMPEHARAARWQLRTRELAFSRIPLVMGILNVTPDSFSDGGKYAPVQEAIDQALRMEDAGAAIVDVGGESTRPYSDPVACQEELQRIVPVLEGLQGRLSIPLSIDTTKAEVAKAALELGAEIVNDISAGEQEPELLEVVREYEAGYCLMHMQGTPQTMQDLPTYRDVVEDVSGYLELRVHHCLGLGIEKDRLCVDPGIGFGKTHKHNQQLLWKVERFHALGYPILVGHSRKGFIGHWIGDKTADRDPGTMAISLAMMLKGVQIVRVHDVAGHMQALRVFEQVWESE